MNLCPDPFSSHRRRFLQRALLGSAGFLTVPGLFAEALQKTPFQTEGPFYPNHLPLDTDNDLILVNDSLTPAVGEITHLHGHIRNLDGSPARGVVIELWLADTQGSYLHTQGRARGKEFDGNFQGYGRFLTGSDGRYYFRAIKPVPYGPRTPHYHIAVTRGGQRLLTTQCYIKGHPLNAKDSILNSVKDVTLRNSLLCEFHPVPGSEAGELSTEFNIIIGATPEDSKRDRRRLQRPGTGFRPEGNANR
ncbi:MAG: intradiol ring-cleavage dioxygenase [Verrucomicrobiota bacterium]